MKYLLYGIAWCGFVTGNVWMGFALPGSRTASQALALIGASLLVAAVAVGVSLRARKRYPAQSGGAHGAPEPSAPRSA